MRVEEFFGIGENPVVSMDCTIHYYSDAEPARVVKVSNTGKTCWIRTLKAEADPSKENGMGHQNWIIGDFENPNVKEPDNYTYFKCTLRKSGKWRTSRSNLYVEMGRAYKYYDWSF